MDSLWLHIRLSIFLAGVLSQTLNANEEPAANISRSPQVDLNEEHIIHKVVTGKTDVKLKCTKSGVAVDGNISWLFMPCKISEHIKNSCEQESKRENHLWKPICSSKETRNCKSVITIFKINVSQNGLYKCINYVQNKIGYVMQTKTLNVFKIQVDTGLQTSKPPNDKIKFIDWPSQNIELKENQSLNINCRVNGYFLIDLVWLKRGNNKSTEEKGKSVPYLSGNFELLNSTWTLNENSKEYLNTLNIKKVRVNDSGAYICAAIDGYGITTKEINVKIINRAQLPTYEPEIQDEFDESYYHNYYKNKWEIFWSVTIFTAIILISCCWTIGVCYCRIFQKALDPIETNGDTSSVTTSVKVRPPRPPAKRHKCKEPVRFDSVALETVSTTDYEKI